MRLPNEVTLPVNPDTAYAQALNFTLKNFFRSLSQKVNALADGKVGAIDNAATTMPTTGVYAVGDFVRNKTPAELGTAASKYVLTGWLCVTSAPLAFLQCRVLTGN